MNRQIAADQSAGIAAFEAELERARTGAETKREQLERRLQLVDNARPQPSAVSVAAALPASSSAVQGPPIGR